MIKKIGLLGLCFLSVAFVRGAFADDNQRIEQLEREVRELKGIVNQLVEENKSLKTSGQETRQEISEDIIFEEAVPTEMLPQLDMHGFAHLQYDYSQMDNADATKNDTNHFTVGNVDLFMTSSVSDRIDFLGEFFFEFESSGSTTTDVERILLKYGMDDWLNISLGRGHTALGYWNQRFHHGTWLQTTAERPAIYRFEDEGGILPVHYIGVEASGQFDVPGGAVTYASNIANGRGTTKTELNLVDDDNDSKMGGILLTYEPQAAPGLGVGANVLYDVIPERAATANRGAEIDELIYGAHTFYFSDPYEFIMEAIVMDHDNHATNLTDKTVGGYGQIAYTIDKYKPYFRYDWLRIADRDPFFEGAVEDESSYTLGLRYELTSYNALKLEYRYADLDGAVKNEATLQSSFAF